MEKPFDVSIEQLAHDLAIISVSKFALDAKTLIFFKTIMMSMSASIDTLRTQ